MPLYIIVSFFSIFQFRGVVQLFNAVRQQQTDISQKLDQAGPLERKREKVLKSIDKRAFLDVLMGGTKTLYVDDQTKSTKVESTETTEDKKVGDFFHFLFNQEIVFFVAFKMKSLLHTRQTSTQSSLSLFTGLNKIID